MYYPAVKEMRIVTESESEYLRYTDTTAGRFIKALVTNVDPEDYGQSSVIRLSDGRFIVFDGGCRC